LNNGKFKGKQLLNSTSFGILMGYTDVNSFQNETLGMGLAWYMHYFNNYIAHEHAGDFWNFASLVNVIPSLNLGLWISVGAGAATARDKISTDLAAQYFPIENITAREIITSSSAAQLPYPSLSPYIGTRRSRTTSDRLISALSAGIIITTYDSSKDQLVLSHIITFSGFGPDSFVDNNLTSQVQLYPYFILSNKLPLKYAVTVEPIAGFQVLSPTDDSVAIIIAYGIADFILLVMMVIFFCISCCFKRDKRNKKAKLGCCSRFMLFLTGNLSSLLFFLCSSISIILIATQAANLTFGYSAPYYVATILPIICIGLFVSNTIWIIIIGCKKLYPKNLINIYLIELAMEAATIVIFFLMGIVSPIL